MRKRAVLICFDDLVSDDEVAECVQRATKAVADWNMSDTTLGMRVVGLGSYEPED